MLNCNYTIYIYPIIPFFINRKTELKILEISPSRNFLNSPTTLVSVGICDLNNFRLSRNLRFRQTFFSRKSKWISDFIFYLICFILFKLVIVFVIAFFTFVFILLVLMFRNTGFQHGVFFIPIPISNAHDLFFQPATGASPWAFYLAFWPDVASVAALKVVMG